ncbi:heterokaryon incompatibility protein-domain-containing protein [Whalleya microplaca]|nr:heterokaryon incompatibility protein-domain-containing protein [Whalleya microplaca]
MAKVVQGEISSALCLNCRNVFDPEGVYYHDCVWMKSGHHSTFEQLVKARESGCHLCYILWHDYTLELNSSATGSITYFLEWDDGRLYTGFQMNGRIKEMHWSRCHGQPLSKQQDFTYSSRSKAIIAWITEQLGRYVHEHANCQEIGILRLPDRVLDVGLIGQDSVRLKNCRNGLDFANYLTLSHRWADLEFPKLTADNESSLEKHILILSLPQTFRDAIEVTRSVGLRYLWIDSLCIQQGSESDWRDQSERMGAIYQNCHFNIAATAASAGGAGLFTSQNPLTFLPVYVQIDTPFLAEEGIFPQPGKTTQATDISTVGLFQLEDRERDEYSLATSATVLHHRAWVFQERLLSPRVLNFGNGGMAWECWEKVILEHNQSLPSKFESCQGSKSLEKFRDIKTLSRWLETLGEEIIEFPEREAGLLQQAYRRWQDVIEIYSRTFLTYRKDKLIALSGLAGRVRWATKDEYLAGLWQGNLVNDLLWVVYLGEPLVQNQVEPVLGFREGSEATARQEESAGDLSPGSFSLVRKEHDWRAPTWSWAYVDAPVYYENDHLHLGGQWAWRARLEVKSRILITLLSSHVIPTGNHPCGQLESAQLEVSGRLLEIQKYTGSGSIPRIRFYFVVGGNIEWVVYPDSTAIERKLKNLEGPLLILPVLLNRYALWGLLLEPDESNNQYRRVGVVQSDAEDLPPKDSQQESKDDRIILV